MADTKRKGTGPSSSVRNTGPAGKQVVGKRGPGGGSPAKVSALSVTPGGTKRGQMKVGTAAGKSLVKGGDLTGHTNSSKSTNKQLKKK